MKIAILYISGGLCHENPVYALKEYIENEYADCQVDVIDVFKHILPNINEMNVPGKNLEDAMSVKLLSILEQAMADIIVCTHPIYLYLLFLVRQKNRFNVPCAALITNYLVNDQWAYGFVNSYIVPDSDIVPQLTLRGVMSHKIYPYGIPTSIRYSQRFARQSVLSSLCLENKPSMLFIGDDFRMKCQREFLESLISLAGNIQILVFSVHNCRLINQASYASKKYMKKIKIFDNINILPELMSISNMLLTYPKPVFINQAIISGTPLAIISQNHDARRKNGDYILSKGIGLAVDNHPESIKNLIELAQNQLYLEQMKSRMQHISHKDAAYNIANLLINIAKDKRPTFQQK